jgi:uronate dehydrogenase
MTDGTASPVLLTGASGRIGTALRKRLPALGWTLRCIDLEGGAGVEAVDVTDREKLDAAMAGVSAVVHLAGIPTERPWPALRTANIDGVFEVFDSARRNSVPRVLFASSIHVVGFTPFPADGEVAAHSPPRPDTLYGVSKACGEALARYFVDRYAMRFACLRLGAFGERPPDARALAIWLSADDCARLIDACLRSPNLEFSIVWGISANTRRVCALDAGYALGYFPVDDAETYADELADGVAETRLGGVYTTAEYGIDEVLRREDTA